ncbi:MAG: hypothetical protein KAI97_07395 [Gemmatimonadetes bacterium]|nr:hypothetical protein [Gemmatimonadota bacterium]
MNSAWISAKNQRGAVAVFTVVDIALLMETAALPIDLGHYLRRHGCR